MPSPPPLSGFHVARVGRRPVTGCPQKALGFCRHLAGGKLSIVAALAVAAHGTYAPYMRWVVLVAIGAPVAVGGSVAHMNSSLSFFLFNLF
jgi:hypothetical protein